MISSRLIIMVSAEPEHGIDLPLGMVKDAATRFLHLLTTLRHKGMFGRRDELSFPFSADAEICF